MNNLIISQNNFNITEMNYIINVKNHTFPNVEGGYDIIIHDHPCFRTYTEYIKIMSVNRNINNLSQGNLLYGKDYIILIHEGLIYEGKLTNDNIYPYKNLPFYSLFRHTITLIIKNVSLDQTNTIILSYKPSQLLQKYSIVFDLDWTFNNKHTHLTIYEGYGGLTDSFATNNKAYTDKYMTKISDKIYKINNVDNNFNYNNDYKNYMQEYYLSNCLMTMVENNIDVLLESIKIPIICKNKIAQHRFFAIGDGITNIKLLKLNKDIKLKNINLLFNDQNDTKYEAEYIDKNNCYEIKNINDAIHIVKPLFCFDIYIEIIADNIDGDVLWLVYDRCLYQKNIRMQISPIVQVNYDYIVDVTKL